MSQQKQSLMLLLILLSYDGKQRGGSLARERLKVSFSPPFRSGFGSIRKKLSTIRAEIPEEDESVLIQFTGNCSFTVEMPWELWVPLLQTTLA